VVFSICKEHLLKLPCVRSFPETVHIWSHGPAREPQPERGLIQLDLPALYKTLPRLSDDQRCTQSAFTEQASTGELPCTLFVVRPWLCMLASLKAVIPSYVSGNGLLGSD